MNWKLKQQMLRVVLRFIALPAVLAIACASCDGGSRLPPPVKITQTSTPPPVEALTVTPPNDGGRVLQGEQFGAAFVIDVPFDWNGELVIYFQGSNRFDDHLSVGAPNLTPYLREHGFALATTSYSTNDIIGRAGADQSAALWDRFAREFGRPKRTYAVGESMGGLGAFIAAEAYADRFDGSLVSCGISGVFANYDQSAAFIAAATYAAETSGAFTTGVNLLQLRWQVAADPQARGRFLRAWESMTGGPRAFFEEGFLLRENALWSLAGINITEGWVDNRELIYDGSDADRIDWREFNRRAPRFVPGANRAAIPANEDATGHVRVPVLITHTTGDGIAPVSDAIELKSLAERAGVGDQVRLWTFANAKHCGTSLEEDIEAFEALVTWVREGTAPENRGNMP